MQIFYDAPGKLTTQSEVGSTLNSNSSKLLWLSLLPARMKKIQSKMKALEWSQQCYIIHHFLRCSRAANSLIGDGILTKFKLIRAFIVVILIWRRSNQKWLLEWSQLCYIIHQFIRCSRAANSFIGDGILAKFKLICAFIVVLFFARMNIIYSNLKALEWSQHFSHYKSMGIF